MAEQLNEGVVLVYSGLKTAADVEEETRRVADDSCEVYVCG